MEGAYADFVTAMMALFIVLWLLNSSEQVRKAISAYFQDPSGSGKLSGSATTGTGKTVSVGKDDMEDLKSKLEQAVKKPPEFEKLKDYIQLSVTGEGPWNCWKAKKEFSSIRGARRPAPWARS